MSKTIGSTTKKKQITIPVYTDEESKRVIEMGAKAVSLNVSAFCRTAAFKEARRILKENSGGSD